MTTEDEPSGQKVSNMILGKNVCVSHSVMSNCLKPHELCVAHQAPLSMVFSRQEYWSGLPEQRALTISSRKNEEAGLKQKRYSSCESVCC